MKQKKGVYLAPSLKAIEIKSRGLMCSSPTTSSSTEQYGTGSTSGWY